MTGPQLSDIKLAREVIKNDLVQTPVLSLKGSRWERILPRDAEVSLKLELFQQAGSFKGRGVFLGIQKLADAERAAGVVAASGGNHALAVAWAAKTAGVKATISMPKAVDPVRIQGCRDLGAEVILCDDMPAAFAVMEEGSEAGKTLMHPFEAEHMILGSATCGLEYVEQCDADTFVIPVGGGGMISGMACAIKQARPSARVIGVEPIGADSMSQSLKQGRPVVLDKIETFADSLGSPKALPMTYGVAAAYVDEMVQITDDHMRAGMKHYMNNLRIMAEPACAASLAAIAGPLKDQLMGQKVGIIACGSNIGMDRYNTLLAG